MNDPQDMLKEINDNIVRFSNEWKYETSAFMNFLDKTGADGALSSKYKELIAIAISIVVQCEWCIAFHVKMAIDKGASRQEIMESCWVAVAMGGGPALMYMQFVQKAIDNFAK